MKVAPYFSYQTGGFLMGYQVSKNKSKVGDTFKWYLGAGAGTSQL